MKRVSFILATFLRRSKSLSVGIDACTLASPVSRKRSFHFSRGDELLRIDGVVSDAVVCCSQSATRSPAAARCSPMRSTFIQGRAKFLRDTIGALSDVGYRRDRYVRRPCLLGRLLGVCRHRTCAESNLGATSRTFWHGRALTIGMVGTRWFVAVSFRSW